MANINLLSYFILSFIDLPIFIFASYFIDLFYFALFIFPRKRITTQHGQYQLHVLCLFFRLFIYSIYIYLYFHFSHFIHLFYFVWFIFPCQQWVISGLKVNRITNRGGYNSYVERLGGRNQSKKNPALFFYYIHSEC